MLERPAKLRFNDANKRRVLLTNNQDEGEFFPW